MKVLKLFFIAVIVLALVFLVMYFKGCGPVASFGIETNDSIENTGQLVTEMKAIKDWEFLVIEDEDPIDSVIRGRIYDDVLVRIYYGSLRLGVDLSELSEDDLTISGDSVKAELPPIKLLDENFIDEARTQAFYEKGKWSDAAKSQLYKKAERTMRQYALSKDNFKVAEKNGIQQMESFFRSLGFKHIDVSFKPSAN